MREKNVQSWSINPHSNIDMLATSGPASSSSSVFRPSSMASNLRAGKNARHCHEVLVVRGTSVPTTHRPVCYTHRTMGRGDDRPAHNYCRQQLRTIIVIPKESVVEPKNDVQLSDHPLLEAAAIQNRTLADMLYAFDNICLRDASRAELMLLWTKMASVYGFLETDESLASRALMNGKVDVALNRHWDALVRTTEVHMRGLLPKDVLFVAQTLASLHGKAPVLVELLDSGVGGKGGPPAEEEEGEGIVDRVEGKIGAGAGERVVDLHEELVVGEEQQRSLAERSAAINCSFSSGSSHQHKIPPFVPKPRKTPDLVKAIHEQTQRLYKNFSVHELCGMMRVYNHMNWKSKQSIRLFTARFCDIVRNEPEVFQGQVSGRHLRTMIGIYPRLKIAWLDQKPLDFLADPGKQAKKNPSRDRKSSSYNPAADLHCLVAEKLPDKVHQLQLRDFAVILNAFSKIPWEFPMAERAIQRMFEVSAGPIAAKIVLADPGLAASLLEQERGTPSSEMASPPRSSSNGTRKHGEMLARLRRDVASAAAPTQLASASARDISLIVNAYAKTNRRAMALPIFRAISQHALGLYVFGKPTVLQTTRAMNPAVLDLLTAVSLGAEEDIGGVLNSTKGLLLDQSTGAVGTTKGGPRLGEDVPTATDPVTFLDSDSSSSSVSLNNDHNAYWLPSPADIPRLDSRAAQDIALLLNACAKLDIVEPALFKALAPCISVNIVQYNTQMLANVAHAFAKMQIRDEPLFDRIAALSVRLMDKFSPRGLATLVYAFGRLQHKHDELFTQIRDEIVYRNTVGGRLSRKNFPLEERRQQKLYCREDHKPGGDFLKRGLNRLFVWDLRSIELVAHGFARLGYHDQRLFYCLFRMLRYEMDGVRQARKALEKRRIRLLELRKWRQIRDKERESKGPLPPHEKESMLRACQERMGELNTDPDLCAANADGQTLSLLMSSFSRAKMPMRTFVQ